MKIETGYRLGKLIVGTDTGIRKCGYKVWCCHCSCGGEIMLDTRALQRGNVLDCGCETKTKPGQKDLSEQRFGKLVAKEPLAERDRNGSTIWRCQCDCGKIACASADMLIRGYKKSCGCLRRKSVLDMSGQQFGLLTVIEESAKQGNHRYWNCRCQCGKMTTVRQSYLLNGKTKSCGCLMSKKVHENMRFIDGTSVTFLENAMNRHNKTNTSGYNGVYYNRKNDKWIAQITFKKKTYYLGSFTNIQEAARIRKKAEEQVYGSFLDWYYSREKRE